VLYHNSVLCRGAGGEAARIERIDLHNSMMREGAVCWNALSLQNQSRDSAFSRFFKTPLSSNTRFIGLQWGPRTLQPDQSEKYTMAIGMAGRDSITGFPVKPPVDLSNFP
jgi:hypothetical protein